MNILFLSWNFPPTRGGIEHVVDKVFHGLRAQDHRVRAITARSDVAESDPEVHRVTRGGVLAYLLAALRKALSISRQSRPDVVLCGSLVTAPIAWILSKRHGVPSLILIHGTDILRGSKLYRATAFWFLRRATRLAANSENTKRLLLAAGIAADRIDVIPPGVDDFDPAAPRSTPDQLAELTQDRPILLTVGRLVRRKGVLDFVQQAMPVLVEQLPEILFLVVGEDPKNSLAHKGEALRDRIQSEIESRGLQDHIKLLGSVDDDQLHQLYRRADLFILPCLEIPGDVEGFGIVFLEAALRETPAVSTRTGGIPEAVVDGTTGTLVDPGDFAAMAKVIHELLTDKARRQELGRNAARRAREEFVWPLTVAKYAASLQQCIDNARPQMTAHSSDRASASQDATR